MGCAGDALTVKQLLDRVRRSVQGAFANSELPTDEQTVMAGTRTCPLISYAQCPPPLLSYAAAAAAAAAAAVHQPA